jgi:hypothetical protein
MDDQGWESVSGPLQKMLTEGFQAGNAADAWLGAEFMCHLLETVFGDVHRSVERTEKGSPSAAPDTATRFRRWAEDGSSRAAFLQDVLAALVRFRGKLHRSEWTGEPVHRFRFLWHDFSRRATDGLFRRPWPADLRRVLRRFWLAFCERSCRELGFAAEALDTGDADLDCVEGMSCALFRDLVRERPPDEDGPGNSRRRTFEDKSWFDGLLARDGVFQRMLEIHGLLRWNAGKNAYEVNRPAIVNTN